MKHNYLILIILTVTFFGLTAMETGAQEVERKVVVELFSNTNCGICANRVPSFNSALEPFDEEVILLSFFAASPYPSCPLYQASKATSDQRSQYYNLPGTPRVYLNGQGTNNSIWSNTATVIGDETGQTSALEVEAGIDIDAQLASVNLIQHAAFNPQEDLVLQVFLVEREVTAGGNPSYMEHHNVVRTQLTPANGMNFDPTSGLNQQFNFDFEIDSKWNVAELAVVAIVQGKGSAEVYNAAQGENILSNTDDHNMKRQDFNFYPNPASDQVTIETTGEGRKTITIFNLLGSKVFNYEFSGSSFTISVENFQRGVYLLRLESRDRPARTMRLVLEK